MRRYLAQKDDPFLNRGHMDIVSDGRTPIDADGSWTTPNEALAPDGDNAYRSWSPPYYSGLPSTCSSSILSDRQSPPFGSPEVTMLPYSPQFQHCDLLFHSSGTPQSALECSYAGTQPCVAMNYVQRYADAQPDMAAYEDGLFYGAHMPQEGFHPIIGDLEYDPGSCADQPVDEHLVPCDSVEEVEPPAIRRRQEAGSRPHENDRAASRTKKRALTPEPKARAQDTASSTDNRAFPCPLAPYGCTSSFAAKNEWKRHANTQHFRLGYWRCDQCSETGKKPNDFNRKDLFVQHFRRMHLTHVKSPSGPPAKKARTGKASKDLAVEEILSQAAERCYKVLRRAPMQSCCTFCNERFDGPGSFEQRLEHVGKHMEDARKEGKELEELGAWSVDEETERWLLEHKVLVRFGRRYRLT